MILRKFLTGLLLIFLLIMAGGYLLVNFTETPLFFDDIITLTASFSVIGVISGIIFTTGMKKGPEARTMYLMVAWVFKLLLEMVLALLWFLIVKKTYLASVILFFVLYLAISLYSMFFILNTLKSKPL
ncbi:MAG TPA: hypothetical protein PLX08_11160 [Bacteroidales bacterium]|nr:hypothetical protein [Bacteroidales bacterium]